MTKDVLYGWRFLRRNAGFTAAAVLTLALGIGANTAIFSFVNALLLRSLPFPDADRLVRIQSVRGAEAGKLMPREWEELERESQTFEAVAGWYPSQYNLTIGDQPEVVRACMTTASLFRTLGVRLALGSAWSEGTHRSRNPAVVLSNELWKNRLGGDPAIVGKSITMDDSAYMVVGVAEPGFQFPSRNDVYRAAHLGGGQNKDVRSLFVVARLRPGVTLEQAQAQLDAFAARQEQVYPESNRGIRFRLSLLHDAYAGEVRPYLLLTMGLAGIVLLIACGNVLNLLLARGLARRREIAVRSALGASGWQIARQLLTECLLLTSLGGVAGLMFAYGLMGILREMLRVDLPSWMSIEFDGGVLLFAILLSLVCGLGAGLAPAVAAIRVDTQSGLREGSRGSSAGRMQSTLRRWLVAAQIGLAVILLVGAGLLARSFHNLRQSDTGFHRDGILTFRTDPPWARYNKVEQTSLFYRLAQERIRAVPGVEAVAANHSMPLALNQNYGKPSIVVDGQSADEQQRNPFVNVQIVSPNYLEVMGVPLHSGRRFTDDDRIGTAPVAILSAPLAHSLFGANDPIGKRVRLPELLGSLDERQTNWFTIIGIARGVRSDSLSGDPSMDLYLSNQQQFAGDTFFALQTRRKLEALTPEVSRAIREVDPGQPIFAVQPLDQMIDDTVWQRRMAGSLSVCFGALALVLAAVGAYGVLSYAVTQRTRELGVRQALGSTPAEVRLLVVMQGMKLAVAGIGAGIAVAIPLALAASDLLYAVAPLDPITFSIAAASVLAVSILACYIPAHRASRIDPAIALRSE